MWRIYFADGSTFSSLEGSPLDAPYKRVAFILVSDPDVGRRIVHGQDAYVWTGREWWWCSERDAFDHVNESPRDRRGFRGQWMHKAEWLAMWDRALADPDFPMKGGFAPDERMP